MINGDNEGLMVQENVRIPIHEKVNFRLQKFSDLLKIQ